MDLEDLDLDDPLGFLAAGFPFMKVSSMPKVSSISRAAFSASLRFLDRKMSVISTLALSPDDMLGASEEK